VDRLFIALLHVGAIPERVSGGTENGFCCFVFNKKPGFGFLVFLSNI
jgi:hypothetical protein